MDGDSSLVFVRIGVYLKQFAVIEERTGEPLQYLTKQFSDPDAFQRYAILIARGWEEMFERSFRKMRL